MAGRFSVLLAAAFSLIAASGVADAAIWEWGCQGQLTAPGQTVFFNRYQMAVLDGQRPLMEPRSLIGDRAVKDLIISGVAGYETDYANESLDKTMVFKRDADPKSKITLTEVTSRRLSHHQKLVCGRDDITDTFRKVYRYERDNEKPRTITMQCMEYQLSTRGGRKGCD